jgi:N4-(beta-N-acetylglucosaminyl)-L-asparaginase
MTRREFVASGAAAAAVGLNISDTVAAAQQPAAAGAAKAAPREGTLLICGGNGIPCCAKAAELLKSGMDPLDAVVGGINVVEDDPADHSVGYGGLPNEDGVVQLDACVMDGRTHKGGAVACIERIKNPSSVALRVMRRSDHVLLVGEGALRFARAHGFKEENLLTEEAREIWLKWKETHSENDDWIRPEADKEATRALRGMDGVHDGIEYTTGTITCMALTPAGDLVGCTSTSGLSYKLPGRVGDSPILGAGLFVDNEVGACGSTGRGEANLQNCTSFLVVELMRQGRTPTEAALDALKRVASRTEKRLQNAKGEPSFGLVLYAIRKDGQVGGACIRGAVKMTVHDGKESRQVPLDAVYKE